MTQSLTPLLPLLPPERIPHLDQIACIISGDGTVCNWCRQKGIRCVFSSTHKPGRKPGTKRGRDEAEAERSKGLAWLASIAEGVAHAACPAKPPSPRRDTNGRRLPSVTTHVFYAPSARSVDPAAGVAAAAAPRPLRGPFLGRDTLVSGSKRRSCDFVHEFDGF